MLATPLLPSQHNRMTMQLENLEPLQSVVTQPPQEIHILLVDDERLSRVVISNLLRKCKYRVTCAESGAEAIDLLTRSDPRSFHLILTDVVMPYGIDGIELLKHVRSSEVWEQISVVMMSANETRATVLECISLGAEDYLLKPVTRKEVQNIWQHVWRRSQNTLAGPVRAPQLSQEQSQTHNQLPEASEGAASDVRGGREAGVEQRDDFAGSDTRASTSGRRSNEPAALVPAVLEATEGLRCGAFVELNDLLESCNLPWATRLEIFSRVLHALVHDARPLSASSPVPSPQPARILASQTGDVKFVLPTPAAATHFSQPFYFAPRTSGRTEAPGSSALVYALGVLLLELAMMPCPAARRREQLLRLSQRVLPPVLLTDKPAVAVLIMRMIAPDAHDRPTLEELTQDSLLAATYARVAESMSATGCADAFMHTEVLLDFLLMVQRQQSTVAANIAGSLQSLDADIAEVEAALARTRVPCDLEPVQAGPAAGAASVDASDASASAGAEPAAKRRCFSPPENADRQAPEAARALRDASPSGTSGDLPAEESAKVVADTKWARLLPLFPHLLTLYQRGRAQLAKVAAGVNDAEAAVAASERRRVDGPLGRRRASSGADSLPVAPHLARVAGDMAAAARYSVLEERAALAHGNPHAAASMLCSIAIDGVEECVATASINKSIKIYRFADMVDPAKEPTDLRYPVLEILSRSKLSCICYNAYLHHRLATSDYEGVVELWDTQANSELKSFEEHTRRVWAIDCSPLDPNRLVSGSDDGTVKLWSVNDETSVATIQARMNVCTVALSHVNANLLAFGTADGRTCLYDMRKLAHPIASVSSNRAVSYVRFMDRQLLSATIDSTIRLFDVDMLCAQSVVPSRVFTGHTNMRNFVGLACNSDGYIMTGSETNELMLYHRSLPAVLAVHRFSPRNSALGGERVAADGGINIVSCVCASQKSPFVFAGSSDGMLKVLHMA